MGQDWKTLSVVIIGAAIAGWLTMRSLGGDSSHRVATPMAAVTTVPPPQRAANVAAAGTDTLPSARAPGAPASPVDPPAAASGGDEDALIQRDLELLSQLLLRDQRIEDRVMPRVNDALDVPGVISYRRGPDFWQSAFAGAAETKP